MRPQEQLAPDSSTSATTSSPSNTVRISEFKSGTQRSTATNGKGIGLALSGGGFRATLFHLGVIAFLRDSNKLSEVTHITSVSGGSILAAHLVLNWEAYTGSQDEFDSVAGEILKFVRKDVRGRVYRRAPLHIPFRFLPQPAATVPRKGRLVRVRSLRKSTTDLLIDHYSELYRDETLEHLEGETARPHLYLLTTNQTDGSLCSFCRNGFRDEDQKLEFEADTISLARAVAASSAFPGLFPPISLTPRNSGIPQRDLRHPEILLTDGGVYDNLGLRKFQYLIKNESIDVDYVVVSDASAEFKVGYRGGLLEPLRTSMRAADILSKRINELERDLVTDDKFKLVYIGRIVKKSIDSTAMGPVLQRELVSIRTDLDKFSQLEISALVRHGYCVARARMEDDRKNGSGEKLFHWWEPLPQSKHADVIALRESNRKENEQLRQRLDGGSRRKLRLASHRDPVTYFQGLVLLSIILGYMFLPSAYRKFVDLRTDASISGQVETLKDAYREEVLKRKVEAAGAAGFAPGIHSNQEPIETWNTAQAAYVLLKSGELSVKDRDFIINAIKTRFVESPQGDYRPGVDGWIGRPSLPHLQAEPALWTGATIAVLLQRDDLDEQTRSELTKLLERVRTYLLGRGFYDPASQQIAFNVLADQEDRGKHSVYSTTLGLMMLIEVDRAGLSWGGEKPKVLIARVLEWLNYEYQDDDPPGWAAMSGDLAHGRPEAATLQCLALMLEAYQQIGPDVPYKLKMRIRDHLQRLNSTGGTDSGADTRLMVIDQDSKLKQAAAEITFLWRPWAIRLSRLWLKHVDEHSQAHGKPLDEDERIAFRELLYRLVVETGSKELDADKESPTFRSSEMLLAYSPLDQIARK